MANSDACAHCGSIFDSRSGLRRHITEGRCSDFDPLAPAQTCDVESTWGLLLRQGKVYKQDLSAVQRLRLTTTCQLCSMTYERQGDLVAHLLQSHGPIWQKSQSILRFLIQVAPIPFQCLCNPMSNEFSVNHVCVGLRQIAMLFEQSTIDVVVPAQLQMPNIQTRLTSLFNDPLYDKLTQLLTHREFALLWTAPELLHLLRTRCLLCGSFHPPARMMEHLNFHHHAENAWATQFLFQLLPCLRTQQHTDYQCNCCTLVYNLPATPASVPTERASLQGTCITADGSF